MRLQELHAESAFHAYRVPLPTKGVVYFTAEWLPDTKLPAPSPSMARGRRNTLDIAD